MVESGLIQGAQQFLTSAGLGQQQPQQMQGGGQFQSQPQGLQQQQPMFTSSSLQQQPQQSLLQPQQQQSFQQQQQPYGSSGVGGVGGSSFVQQGTGTGVGMGQQSSLLSSSAPSVLPQQLQQQPLTSVGSFGVQQQQQPQSIQSFQQQQPQSIQSSSSFYQQPQQQQPLSQSWQQQPIQQHWSSSSSTRAAPIASSSYTSSSTLTSSGYGSSGLSSGGGGIDSGYSSGTSTGQQKFTQQQRQSPTSTTGTTTTTTSQFPLDGFNLLLQDQRDIIDLYDNHYMTEKDPVHKRQILSLLIEELCIHSSIDEVIVFPLIELLLVPDGKRLAERNYWQHLLNRIHFQKILEMDMNDKMFDSSVQHMVYMRDQMKNNEFDIYAHAKQKMTQEQLAVLYRLVEAARQLAPSVPRDNHSWFRGRIVEVFDDLKYSIKQLHQHQQHQQQQQQQFSRC